MVNLRPSHERRIHICGHRGHVVDGHENSRPALGKAAALGASFCEIDLRRTRDGRFVVFHDDILDNASTGRGLISELTFGEIAAFRTKSRSGQDLDGQPIEAFEDMLLLGRELGLCLVVEVKDAVDGVGGIAPVLDSIETAGMADRVLISSFDHVILRDIKLASNRFRTMGISYHRLVEPARVAGAAKMDVLNTDYPQFSPEIAHSLHAAGIAVSHYVPRPEFFALRREYGSDYYRKLARYIGDGLIDMLVCDDVEWASRFARSSGVSVWDR